MHHNETKIQDMKKIIITAIALIISLSINAQEARNMPVGAKPTGKIAARWNNYERSQYFSVRTGLNVSQLYFSGMDVSSSSIAGFQIGFAAGWQLSSRTPLFAEVGISYSGKGASVVPPNVPPTLPVEGGYNKLRYRMHTLNIPVVLKYKIRMNQRNFSIQPLFGLYMNLGMGGNCQDFWSRTTTGSFDDNLDVFDAGLRLGCGMAYTNFYMELTYDIGLVNLAGKKGKFRYTDRMGYDDFDGGIRSGNLAITLGVEF